MRCRKAREEINKMVDGELDPRRAARLDRHLAECGECRALLADLRKIVGGAAEIDGPEPSDEVWRNIRAGEGAPLDRRPLFGLGLPAVRYAGAAALALVLVVSGLVIGRRLGRQDARMSPAEREVYTLAKLDEAQDHYEQAVRALSEAFAAEKGALDPQVAELFERNLAVIDTTIQACRAAVRAEPDDLEARNYLLAAYTQKAALLDSALDFQREHRSAEVGKTTI
jgi:anti-sigma factor RsiW